MPSNTYQKKPIKMLTTGMSTNMPPDILPPGKFPILRNVRQIQPGVIETRPGIRRLNNNPLPIDSGHGVHTIRRLNDNIGPNNDGVGDFTRVVAFGQRVGIEIDTTVHQFTIMGPSQAPSLAWSGRPLSMTPWRPERSARTWMYVWDTFRCEKIGRDDRFGVTPVPWAMYHVGINPPNAAPSSVVNTAAGVGPAGVGAVYYRYRYRASGTGAKSNPSPVPVVGGQGYLAAVTGNVVDVTVLMPTDGDGQIDFIDIFRFGNALLDYRYVGSVRATPTTLTFHDTLTDAQAQENEILGTDNDKPFTVAGLPLEDGVCNTTINSPFAGVTTVTRVSGPVFKQTTIDGVTLSIGRGSLITIDGKVYALYSDTTSTASCIIVGVTVNAAGAAANLSGVKFNIEQPSLVGKPLPFVWGPFNNVIFACGDFYNPGTLYWTNAKDPDSASSENFQEVTPSSEPLMNGFTNDEKNYVFSSERLFVIYPNFLVPNTWTILETPCQRGLLFNWAFCTTGEKQGGDWIYFLAKDGIWRTQGGLAECITVGDLYNLFPHEGSSGVAYNPISAEPLYPIELGDRYRIRLSYGNGLVYFDYKDTQGVMQTLVYDTKMNGWIWDNYDTTGGGTGGSTAGLRCHYCEEGREVTSMLAGSDNGLIYQYSSAVNTDDGNDIICRVRPSRDDQGDPGAQKLYGDVTVEMDTGDNAVTVLPFFNNENIQLLATNFPGPAGRRQFIMDFNQGQGQLAYNFNLDFQWDNIGLPLKLYMWMPSAAPKPEDSLQRCSDWHEFIVGGDDAYVTGIRIWCDTRDINGTVQTKTVQVWSDEVYTGNVFLASANGEQKLEFSWPQFKGKLGRLQPVDANRWRVLKWEWIAEPEPLLISKWDTNWRKAGDGLQIAYVTGCVVQADTQGAGKTLTFQYEFEGSVTNVTAIGGSNTISHAGRLDHSFAFLPFRAEQLRFYSYDDTPGRLYDYQWIVHLVEPRFLANWDATYQDWKSERLIKGVRVYADTLNQVKQVRLEIDNVIYTTFNMQHNGREVRHYDVPIDPMFNEFPRGRSVRLYPIDSSAAFLYSVEWFADEEPGRLANWNAKWDDGGYVGAKWLQGFRIDADTQGVTKSVVVEYYKDDFTAAIQVAATLTVNHPGRTIRAYSLNPPVITGKWRVRPTDSNQRWLYSAVGVWQPEPDLVRHWETQGYSQHGQGYEHRRDGYLAYASTDVVYWIINIDGVKKAYRFPPTGGTDIERKVYVPFLPIKGKIFKDIVTTFLPADVPVVYVANLQNAVY